MFIIDTAGEFVRVSTEACPLYTWELTRTMDQGVMILSLGVLSSFTMLQLSTIIEIGTIAAWAWDEI
jgi:hypothetical protein